MTGWKDRLITVLSLIGFGLALYLTAAGWPLCGQAGNIAL